MTMEQKQQADTINLEYGKAILFGDSITQQSFGGSGWGARLSDYYVRRLDVLNRGFSGYNSRLAVGSMPHIFPSPSPTQLVTVFFGANDACREGEDRYVSITEYKHNIREIVRFMQKHGGEQCAVIIITPPPINRDKRMVSLRKRAKDMDYKPPSNPSRDTSTAGKYAKACLEVGAEADVSVLDVWSLMQLRREPFEWAAFLSDGLHLSEKGNAFVASELMQHIETHYPHLSVQPCIKTGSHHNAGSTSQLPKVLPWNSEINHEDWAGFCS